MPNIVTVPDYGSEAWVSLRRRGIGASELPALAGVDQWKGEYEVAIEKRGESEPFTGNAATRWGHRIESVAIDAYEEETGRAPVIRGETWHDDRWPHLWATLDGRWERIGVEVKATTRWTEPPSSVQMQAYAQMGLAGLDAVDVVRVSPYGEPIITTIERDDDLIHDLLDMGEAWYVRYVLGDELPPVDASKAASRHLDRLRGTEERAATDEQEALLAKLREVRATKRQAEQVERQVINELKASMAGTGTLAARDARVSWSEVRGRITVDWRSVAQMLASMAGLPPEQLDEAAHRHTSIGDPTTRFAVKFTEEE